MIELENVSKRYDGKAAIEKMDLLIPRGRIYGLIGPNGAGKTTALKMMATLIKPDEGAVRIGGLDLPARVAEARRSIGYMADRQGNFRGLTAEEYLAFFGRLHGISGPSLAARIGPVMFFLFRARRRRIWVWAYAPLVSLVFILAAPAAFRLILTDPSIARETAFAFIDASGEGVSHTRTEIHSAGRQDHRIRFHGEDVTAFKIPPGIRLPLGSSRGPGDLELPSFSMAPWSQSRIVTVKRVAAGSPPEVSGTVTVKLKGGLWHCEVKGLRRGSGACVVIFNPDEWLAPAARQSGGWWWGNNSSFLYAQISDVRSMDDAVALDLTQNQRQPPNLRNQRLVFSTGSEGQEGPWVLPRAFVIWQEAEPRPALESPDIVYDPESRRQAFAVRELDVVIPDVPPEKSTKEE